MSGSADHRDVQLQPPAYSIHPEVRSLSSLVQCVLTKLQDLGRTLRDGDFTKLVASRRYDTSPSVTQTLKRSQILQGLLSEDAFHKN